MIICFQKSYSTSDLAAYQAEKHLRDISHAKENYRFLMPIDNNASIYLTEMRALIQNCTLLFVFKEYFVDTILTSLSCNSLFIKTFCLKELFLKSLGSINFTPIDKSDQNIASRLTFFLPAKIVQECLEDCRLLYNNEKNNKKIQL